MAVFPTSPPVPSSILGLPIANSPLGGGEWAVIVQNGITVRVPTNQLILPGQLNSVAAGTGILVSQTGGVATVSLSVPVAVENGGTGASSLAAAGIVTTSDVNTVTNTMLAQAPGFTIKGNNTGGTANVMDLTASQVAALLNLNTISPQGRLTLISNTPIMNADTVAATTVYYTPLNGNIVPIYNGTQFIAVQFSQLSLSLDSNSGHTGYQQSGKLFDLFLFSNSGVLNLGTAPAWTSNTVRSNNIGQLQGIWVNSAPIVIKYDTTASTFTVPTFQATYVGTMYATGDGQTTMQFTPAAASGGPAAIMGLYNAYNRVRTPCVALDSTSSWTYTSSTWRGANNSAGNRINFIDGLGQSFIMASYNNTASNATSSTASIGVGLDSTTTPITASSTPVSSTSTQVPMQSNGIITQQGGYHFLQALESDPANTGTTTFYGGQQMYFQIVLDM